MRFAITALFLTIATSVDAQESEPVPDAGPATGNPDGNDAGAGDDFVYETTVIGDRRPAAQLPKHRAGSEVTRKELRDRLPRSAPDVLLYEPGVFIQKTAHGQGSAFIRGLTGQQTLLMFDGIRLNNSTYRQGPNQYFFTLDSQTIQSIQVVRGGASTRYGSDAIGGVIMTLPIEPELAPAKSREPATWQPHVLLKGGTADRELGGRAQTNLTFGDSMAVFGGVGGRRVGLLESGGTVTGPGGDVPGVPRFDDDGRTQLGTGFDELTGDVAAVYRVNSKNRFKMASYFYRQYDAPRTDKCPAAYAPYDECLKYDEQFRTLAYGVWEGEPKLALVKNLRATVSWQNQHERRSLSRPSSYVLNTGRDDVNTVGGNLTAETAKARPASWLGIELGYGADTYHDFLDSSAWITFDDIGHTEKLDRGQYVDGSNYTYGGAFLDGSAELFEWLILRAGGRVSWIAAQAPAVPEAGSESIDKTWIPLVGNAGVETRATEWLSFLFNVDHSFRAPNLDDMTSRQQTGPGFQFENPDLKPETADTFEVGARVGGPVTAELWAFRTLLHGAVVKRPMEASDCPPGTPQCTNSWTRFQLVNADERSEVRGLEAYLGSELPGGFSTRFTVAWTWGEGPNMGDPPSDPAIPFDESVPLSRIPPLNGTAELGWMHRIGISTSAALRWAATQDRLALADVSDERIPPGGTPGFAVLDLRLSYRLEDKLFASVVFENILDTAYRYHGSAVNSPARGLVFLLDLGPLWRL
ncbi:MAG: TonB-dependent receptor [Deltaproteobacteria bacterium]|nr:TonB-dependent receptor [Deltaproteobacteria bacterium]